GGGIYGADIVISFMPKEPVDAEAIALVQSVQATNSSIGDQLDPLDRVPQPDTVTTEKAQDVFKSRLVGTIGRDFGRHIDQDPRSRTPLATTTVDSKSTDLAKSVPVPDFKSHGVDIHTQFGFRTDKKGPVPAQMADTPRLTLPVTAIGSKNFETAALAIDGVQKGTYYGSVKWGWRKDENKTTPVPMNFEKGQDSAPSSGFFAAAAAWNASKNTNDEASIPLPI